MRGRFRQPTSRWVGFAVAGAYVVITAVTGTALLVAGQQISTADAQAARSPGAFAQYTDTITVTNDPHTLPRTRTTTTTPSPTTVTTRVTTQTTTRPPQPHTTTAKPTHRPAKPGYQQVTGPAGMHTVVPDGWARARATGPGADVATDPADPDRYVKFGGSPASGSDMLATHLMYEATYAARGVDYHRVSLAGATFHKTEAVVWEFRFSGPGGTQHAKSLYWRIKGTEYFVLVSGPERDWPRMSAIYQQMVASAKP